MKDNELEDIQRGIKMTMIIIIMYLGTNHNIIQTTSNEPITFILTRTLSAKRETLRIPRNLYKTYTAMPLVVSSGSSKKGSFLEYCNFPSSLSTKRFVQPTSQIIRMSIQKMHLWKKWAMKLVSGGSTTTRQRERTRNLLMDGKATWIPNLFS